MIFRHRIRQFWSKMEKELFFMGPTHNSCAFSYVLTRLQTIQLIKKEVCRHSLFFQEVYASISAFTHFGFQKRQYTKRKTILSCRCSGGIFPKYDSKPETFQSKNVSSNILMLKKTLSFWTEKNQLKSYD